MKSMCDKCNFKSCCEEEKKQINLKEVSSNQVIMGLIETITKIATMNPEELIKLEDFIINNSISLDEKDGIFIVEAFNKKYKFSKISDFIDNKYYDELTSELRYKRCHSRSIMLCKEIQSSSVLTGYINGTHTHVLHSVLEVESFNTKYIYDWTKNLILKSKDYIDLTNYEVISRVTHDQLISDIEIIELLNLEECLKKYLLFRNEIVKDFKKKTLHL